MDTSQSFLEILWGFGLYVVFGFALYGIYLLLKRWIPEVFLFCKSYYRFWIKDSITFKFKKK